MSEATQASVATTIATKKNMRPVTLTAAAIVLVLSALFTFASPWLPRGRGFGFGAQGPRNGQTRTGNAAGGGGGAGGGAGGAGGAALVPVAGWRRWRRLRRRWRWRWLRRRWWAAASPRVAAPLPGPTSP